MIQVIEEKRRGMVNFSKWDRGRSPTGKEEWECVRVCTREREREKRETEYKKKRQKERKRENAIGWCRQEGLV